MAGFVGIRKNAWDAASTPQKRVARILWGAVGLGDPVLGTAGGQEWYVFYDRRVTPELVENLGWLFSHLTDFTDSPNRASRGDYATTELVDVEVPVYEEQERTDPETGETYTVRVQVGTTTVQQDQPIDDSLKLAANSYGLAWFAANSSLPNGWTPNGVE